MINSVSRGLGDEDWRCDGGSNDGALALDSSLTAVEVDDSLGLSSALVGPLQLEEVSATASFGKLTALSQHSGLVEFTFIVA